MKSPESSDTTCVWITPREAAELLAQVEAELTQLGWDTEDTAIPALRHQAIERDLAQRESLLRAAHELDHPGPSL